MKFTRITFIVNACVVGMLALIMIFLPNVMAQLIYVPQPNILIQTIGSVGISMAILAVLAYQAQLADKSLVFTRNALVVLLVFNLGLSLFLGYAAYLHYISWLGLAVHAPLAILCAMALNALKIK